MGHIKLKKASTQQREIISKMKRQSTMGENIFKSFIWIKGYYAKYINNLYNLTVKNQTIQLTDGQRF